MSKNNWVFLVAVALVLGLGVQPAQAQYGPNYYNPYSPYLNLFRRGGSVTSNYYGLVVPQLQAAAGLQQLQYQVNVGKSGTIQVVDTGIQTGILAGFQTQGTYFGGGGLHGLTYQPTTINSRNYSAGPGAPTIAIPSTQPLTTPYTSPQIIIR